MPASASVNSRGSGGGVRCGFDDRMMLRPTAAPMMSARMAATPAATIHLRLATACPNDRSPAGAGLRAFNVPRGASPWATVVPPFGGTTRHVRRPASLTDRHLAQGPGHVQDPDR